MLQENFGGQVPPAREDHPSFCSAVESHISDPPLCKPSSAVCLNVFTLDSSLCRSQAASTAIGRHVRVKWKTRSRNRRILLCKCPSIKGYTGERTMGRNKSLEWLFTVYRRPVSQDMVPLYKARTIMSISVQPKSLSSMQAHTEIIQLFTLAYPERQTKRN